METKEINTLVVLFADIDKSISDLLLHNAIDQLGRINVEELRSKKPALKYLGKMNPTQRDKFDKFCEEHGVDTLYLEYDANMEDNVSNLFTANYE